MKARVALGLLLLGAPAAAQTSIPVAQTRARAAIDAVKADSAWTLEQQISICEIAAPPFKEQVRAAELRRRFESLGLRNVRIDAIGNVIAERPGKGTGPSVMLAGHLDTVFPEGTDVKVKRVGARLTSPGIGDDCRGLAVLLTVARAFQTTNLETTGTTYFVGDVGEEGAGNLRGMRHLFEKELKGKIDHFISLDGPGHALTIRAVGSHRYRILFEGPGGHSYSAFGRVNPIHALGRAIAAIADVRVPSSPRTTFSVGTITGGTSVNSIPFEASAELDMRSESAEELAKLDRKIQAILRAALAAENARWGAGASGKQALRLRVDTIGIRPASGTQTEKSPIVATALEAAKALGFTPTVVASSTDANLPMSMGIPAITIEVGGRGGDAHSLNEWYEDTNPTLGPQWAVLLAAALAGVN